MHTYKLFRYRNWESNGSNRSYLGSSTDLEFLRSVAEKDSDESGNGKVYWLAKTLGFCVDTWRDNRYTVDYMMERSR